MLRHNMAPILCVGESAAERAAGEAGRRVAAQLSSALSGRRAEEIARCVVAYEPLWAIGTGVTATPEDAESMCAHIHRELQRLGGASALSVRVQYGGSVTVDNAAALLAQPSVDGLLVGGTSLDAANFIAIAPSPAALSRVAHSGGRAAPTNAARARPDNLTGLVGEVLAMTAVRRIRCSRTFS